MNHHDHVNLLRGAIPHPEGIWADLGAGSGAFTLALAELFGPQGRIYALDKDAGALRAASRAMSLQFAGVPFETIQADFTRGLNLPPLDGMLMANSLHFIPHVQKPGVLSLIKSGLRPGGRLVLVEYNVEHGNVWVPYPFTYPTWEIIAARAGFKETRLVATRSSSFLNEFYCAMSIA